MKTGLMAAGVALLLAIGMPLASVAGPALDNDGDGVYNVLDNCSAVSNGPLTVPANPNADCDTDNDGYGNFCDCDYVNTAGKAPGDLACGVPDFAIITMNFGAMGAPGFISADQNCDGSIGVPDFGKFSAKFGKSPAVGPSGLHCAGKVPCDL